MPLYYELPNLTNGMQDLLVYNNTVTGNLFSSMLLLTMFLILFIGFKARGYQSEKSFAGAIFPTTIISYLMMIIPGFLSPEITVILSMLTALSVIMLYRSGGETYY